MALIDDLRNYYSCDEGSGSVIDQHGSDDLAAVNTPLYEQTGIIDYGVGGDGTNDGFSKNVSYSSIGSINIWVKLTNTTQNHSNCSCLSTYNSNAPGRFMFNFDAAVTTTFEGVFNDGGSAIEMSFGATDTSYHMLTLTFDGTTFLTYYDGSFVNEYTASTTAVINWVRIKLLINDNDNQFLNGTVDEVGIWTRVLDGLEVSDLYNGGAGLAYPFDADTNMQINIGDVWKEVDALKINIGDVWKEVASAKIQVNDLWKEVF